MKKRLFGLFAVAVLLGGCGAGPLQMAGETGLTPLSVTHEAAMTMAHYVPVTVHSDHSTSWMLPQKKKSILIYVGDWSNNDVYVLDYFTGKVVGTLTGFSEPYGMCVDAKGDVYIANFGEGDAVEYEHGGTKVINTYASGGSPIGCAIDRKGDVAVTSFDPGEVTVYTHGNPSKGTTYSDSACQYEWTAGYDGAGDLIGQYENGTFCALMAGSQSETTLTSNGITIDFPGGTTWDGKYIALGDQEAAGTYQTGIWPATLSGSTLTPIGKEVEFADTCYGDYVDDVNPFIVGKKNTPVNDRRGHVMVGPNLWCYDAGEGGGVEFWHYPKGGDPFKEYSQSGPPMEFYGLGVSIGG
jgi:YVTN family beta-propeller protein